MNQRSNSSVFATYTIVAILSATISFVTMIVLTRTTSEAFFGQINKFLTASYLVMSLICLGLDTAYIRFYYEPPENTNSKQLAWKCIFPALVAFILVSSAIMYVRDRSILYPLIGGGGVFFTVAFVITVLSQFLNRFMTIYFRMNNNVLDFSVLTIAFTILTKTIFIPTYYIAPKFEDNIVLVVPFLAMFMLVFFTYNAKNMISFSHDSFFKYKRVYRYALFSSPVFVITYLNSYLPQVIISNNLGDSVLGIYSAALLFCSAIQVLSMGFSTFWSPYMYKNYKTENDMIKRVHDIVLLASVLVMSLILIFNDFIYLFIGEAFRKNQNILGLLLIYPIVLIIVDTVAYGIGIKKKNEISLLIYLTSTITNVTLCIILISKYGLDGIAFASMISGIVLMTFMTYFGQKYYQSINQISRTLFHIFVLILSAISFYFLYDYRIMFIIAETTVLAICLVYDRNVILWSFDFLKSIRNKRNK